MDKRLFVTPSSMLMVENLLEGHHRFLKRNTGTTEDPKRDLFVFNEEGVLANNRHFISDTRQEYQPNGDSTTEGQSLQVLGYVYAYLATGNQEFLEYADWCWEAYVSYYYRGQAIPVEPQRWIANWLVNGKEPCLANWPVNPEAPTAGGFKGVPLMFVNGQAQIPHGSPFWGEYLDVVSFAFRGHLGWNSLSASVRPIEDVIDWDFAYSNHRITTMPDRPYDQGVWFDWQTYLGKPLYSVDWSSASAPELEVDWIIAWTNNKISGDGDILEEDQDPTTVGTIQLKDTSVNGCYLLNYAVKLPVEHGGYMFSRNEPWHNRPIHAPLLGSVNQMGNAADGEVWFADACYLMWKVTGKAKYKMALDSVLITAYEYTNIDSEDMFFRQDPNASTPFTDGISYDFIYPDVAYEARRNAVGDIVVEIEAAAQYTMEQQAVKFRVNQESFIKTTFGGLGIAEAPVSAKIEVTMSLEKSGSVGSAWFISLPASTSLEPVSYEIPVGAMVKLEKPDGQPYVLADTRSVTDYGTTTWQPVYEEDILGERAGTVVEANIPDSSSGFIIGNWLYDNSTRPIEAITYRSSAPLLLRIVDTDGWYWDWLLESTEGAWITRTLLSSELVFRDYQPNHLDATEYPTVANYNEVEQITIILANELDVNTSFAYYCLNELPPRYELEDGYTLYYRLTLSSGEAFTAVVGDCTVTNPRDDSLNYCPGIIPFSNIYQEGSNQFAQWRGLPYPGYQYPVIYMLGDGVMERHLNNIVDFLYDAQQYYYSEIGELGPVASAYIWDRPDATVYGPANTFTMYHWGDGNAWSGYQPRAFQGGARALQELSERNLDIPPKLIDYVDNWVAWLVNYLEIYGESPTDFPATTPSVQIPNDFTGHMSGLWLAGLCHAFLGGCRVEGIGKAIEVVVTELCRNYEIMSLPEHPMSGSWSPWTGTTTIDAVTGKPRSTGMFFGFWSGEIMRGLGMYMMYRKAIEVPTVIDTSPANVLVSNFSSYALVTHL